MIKSLAQTLLDSTPPSFLAPVTGIEIADTAAEFTTDDPLIYIFDALAPPPVQLGEVTALRVATAGLGAQVAHASGSSARAATSRAQAVLRGRRE